MLVVEYKLVDYQYFMDFLNLYEIQLLTSMLPWAIKQDMEQTRMLMYTFSAPYTKHMPNIKQWMPLPTDNEKIVYEKLGEEEISKAREMIRSAFKKNRKN